MKREPLPSVGWSPKVQAQIDAAFRAKPATADEAPERPRKYRNVPEPFLSTQGFSLVAASKAEARDYEMLDLGVRTGIVLRWVPQVSFLLPGGIRYKCDALVWWADGRVTVRDCKGVETRAFRDRKRLMLSTYGLEIEIVP